MKKDTRKQRMVRLHDSMWKKIKAKTVLDKLTYQKLVEVLLTEYINGNKYLEKIVQKYSSDKLAAKRRHSFSQDEAEQLFNEIGDSNIDEE